MTCHSRSANCIRLVFAAVAAVLWMPPAHAVTEDQIIDDVAVLVNPVNTADIQAELEELIGGLVADTSDYNGLAFQWNNSLPVLMWFRGRVTSTLAPLIPLMPGEVSNAATLRGSLAARLRREVQNFLLQQGFWEFEQYYQNASQYYTELPNTYARDWHHRFLSGPWWEKFHSVWAYCHYTGDWAILSSNNNAGLNFLKNRYNQGNQTRASQRYLYAYHFGGNHIFRDDPIHLVKGLIGFTRILDHFNDAQESAVRAAARTALGHLNATAFTDRSVSNGQAFAGWDNTSTRIQYDYPPGESMCPEIGRWLRDKQLTAITNRVQEALTNTVLKDRYNAHLFNNYDHEWVVYDEAQNGLPNISYQLFNCRAWVMQVAPETLRSELPWPVLVGRHPKYRDMHYIGALYTLLARHATVTWVVAEPD